MRNKQLDKLHLVHLTETGGYVPLPSGGLDSALVEKTRQNYISKLHECSSSWPTGSAEASCPYPVIITQRHQDDVKNLHSALNLAITDIIERWWTDEEAQFPRRMPLEQEEEELLRVGYPFFLKKKNVYREAIIN